MTPRPPWWIWAAAVGIGLYLGALPFLQYRLGAAHHAHGPRMPDDAGDPHHAEGPHVHAAVTAHAETAR